MKVVITGGAGMIGQAVARLLTKRGELAGIDGIKRKISRIVLSDMGHADTRNDPRVVSQPCDVGDREAVRKLIGTDTDSVFHFAGVVSMGAEKDFDLGYRVNLDGTRNVLEVARAAKEAKGTPLKVVFTSTLAVYGGNLPPEVNDDTPLTPQTSYGNQKAMGELMINDYSRKGFIDGRSLRLNTIMVRPGRPNLAASTWASSIAREPLSGIDAVCPVTRETPMIALSPRRTAESLVHAHDLPAEAYGPSRTVLLNGRKITAGDIVDAVERNKGNRKIGKVEWRPDPFVQNIVNGWPKGLRGERAEKLGFQIDRDIDEIIRIFIEDDLDDQMKLIAND